MAAMDHRTTFEHPCDLFTRCLSAVFVSNMDRSASWQATAAPPESILVLPKWPCRDMLGARRTLWPRDMRASLRLFGHHSPPPTARVQRNTPAAPLPLASKLLSLRQDVKDAFRDAVGDVNNVKMVGSNGSAVVEFAKKKAKALLPF